MGEPGLLVYIFVPSVPVNASGYVLSESTFPALGGQGMLQARGAGR